MAHPRPRNLSPTAQNRIHRTAPYGLAPSVVPAAVAVPLPEANDPRARVTVRPSRLGAPFDRGFPATMREVLAVATDDEGEGEGEGDTTADGDVLVAGDEPVPTPGLVDRLLAEYAYLETYVNDLQQADAAVAPDAQPEHVYLAFLRTHAQLGHVATTCDLIHTRMLALRRQQVRMLRLQLAADEADLARLEHGHEAGFAALAHHVRHATRRSSRFMDALQRLDGGTAPAAPRDARGANAVFHVATEARAFAEYLGRTRAAQPQWDPPSSPSITSPPDSPRSATAAGDRPAPRKHPRTGGKHPRYAGKGLPPTPVPATPPPAQKRPRPFTGGKQPPLGPPQKRPRPSTGGKQLPLRRPPSQPARRPSSSVQWSSDGSQDADSASDSDRDRDRNDDAPPPPPPPPLVLRRTVHEIRAHPHLHGSAAEGAAAARDDDADDADDDSRSISSPTHIFVNLNELAVQPLV